MPKSPKLSHFSSYFVFNKPQHFFRIASSALKMWLLVILSHKWRIIAFPKGFRSLMPDFRQIFCKLLCASMKKYGEKVFYQPKTCPELPLVHSKMCSQAIPISRRRIIPFPKGFRTLTLGFSLFFLTSDYLFT